MQEPTRGPVLIDGLYGTLIEGGINYFFPSAELQVLANGHGLLEGGTIEVVDGGSLILHWLGSFYSLRRNQAFSEEEVKLLRSIGAVLESRYKMIAHAERVQQRFELFHGLPEDRYVSASIERDPYEQEIWQGPDRVEDAIEVLRTSSLSTYENRRISTGALLFGGHPDPCHERPVTPTGALRYSPTLTSIRSFYRLCDGLQTLALVDQNGVLAEIVDVQEWAAPYSKIKLPVPSPAKYESHAQATLCGGHICMILTPNGEMKIFANGVQVFQFLDGRWRLTDAQRKYELWREAIGSTELAESLFAAAMNLAEDRRGALLVVLDDPETAEQLVTKTDLVSSLPNHGQQAIAGAKDQLHYLLHQKRTLDLPTSVLETVARIDGGIVLDLESNLLAFGAILRHHDSTGAFSEHIEGGRTTAAISASHFGNVLKISEDGLISFFQNGKCVWDI
jgi:DNA integrity scanning protein DisA with diadenylate cyclase activity